MKLSAVSTLAVVVVLAAGCATAPPVQERPERVVYHFSEAGEQPVRGMQFIRNHLEANPKARIVVVTHAAGVDFLMKGAKTERGNPYLTNIEDLEMLDVKFFVCEITLRERNLTRAQFVGQAAFVHSGVAEISRLQHNEGYSYLKP